MWNSIIDDFDKSDVHLHGRYDIPQPIVCMCLMSFTKSKYLVTATYYGDLILWDLDTFERSEELPLHSESINDIKECKTNFRLRSCLLTGSTDKTMKLTSVRLGEDQVQTLVTLRCEEAIGGVAEMRNYVVVGAAKNKIYFWSLEN